jgi:glutathione S-transferase
MGPAWTRTFRCLWMLEELGVPYEHVDAQPVSRRVKKFNPSGKVPVLLEYEDSSNAAGSNEEPSFVLTESVAINTYLGDCYDVHKIDLVPAAGTRERAIYDATVCSILSELDAQSLGIHSKHERFGQYFGYIPDAVEHSEQHFQRMNEQIAGQVITSGGPYLLGAKFTAADILYVQCLDWASSIGWKTEQWPEHLAAYRSKCHERAAYQRVKGMQDVGNKARKEKESRMEAASSASSSTRSNDNRSKL